MRIYALFILTDLQKNWDELIKENGLYFKDLGKGNCHLL